MAYITGSGHTPIPILSRANVVIVSLTNSDPAITKSGVGAPNEPDMFYPTDIRNFVRISSTDDREGTAGAKWASQLGLRRVYVLDDRTEYGHVAAAEFVAAAKKLGLQIVG